MNPRLIVQMERAQSVAKPTRMTKRPRRVRIVMMKKLTKIKRRIRRKGKERTIRMIRNGKQAKARAKTRAEAKAEAGAGLEAEGRQVEADRAAPREKRAGLVAAAGAAVERGATGATG